MIRLAPALALLALTSAAHAAPVTVWNGPGPRACNSACTEPWALSEAARAMPADVHAAMAAAIEAGPAERTRVMPGQILAMNTYASAEGRPLAEVRPIVADLVAPEPAQGWYVRDAAGTRWGFVRVDGCANWQVTVGTPPATPVQTYAGPMTVWGPGYLGPIGYGTRGGGASSYFKTHTTVNNWTDDGHAEPPRIVPLPQVPGQTPPPIPLPAAAWLLACGVAALIAAKRGLRRQ